MPSDEAFASYPSLAGRPVVISGGATGIGEGIVRAFAAQGSKVGFVDIAAEAGRRLEAELTAAGRTVRFIECDITDVAAYRAAIESLAASHGACRALVNNAANDQRHKWDEITPEIWEAGLAVNLRHSFFAAQAVAPGMIAAGGGAIINFGSFSWMIMVPDLAPYTASKAAMHGLSRSLARELGPHGIRVNTLVPGWIMTERQLTRWVGEAENRLIDASQALKGRLYPADIARMALFLAAEDSRMISGQDFIVDGGWAHG
jgi:NAD(P)-dependent dehydrogenase (short-subunit alcohol dehydrogenase family)